MIYSRRRGFVFVKGTKVASTSVEMALSTLCGDDDIVTPITPVDELARIRGGGRGAQLYLDDRDRERSYAASLETMSREELARTTPPLGRFVAHMTLSAIARELGGIPSGTLVFAVERSPYEKVISFANMTLRFDDYRATGASMRSDLVALRKAIAKVVSSGRAVLVRNVVRYRAPAGVASVRILRHDRLEADFARLLADLKLPSVRLPHAKEGMRSSRFDPRELFEPQHLARVNEEFAEEFEAFGWPTFEP
jgi:hypothetical protein